jgi:hypothetical protein
VVLETLRTLEEFEGVKEIERREFGAELERKF